MTGDQDAAAREAAELLPAHDCDCANNYRPAVAAKLRERDERWMAQKLEAEKQWRDIVEIREKRIAALESESKELRDTYAAVSMKLTVVNAENERLRAALNRARKMLGPHSLHDDAEGFAIIDAALAGRKP